MWTVFVCFWNPIPGVHVCLCVCVRERARERGTSAELKAMFYTFQRVLRCGFEEWYVNVIHWAR